MSTSRIIPNIISGNITKASTQITDLLNALASERLDIERQRIALDLMQ